MNKHKGNKYCNVCGKFSKNRNVCLECKKKFPYVPAPTKSDGGGQPFNRKELLEKQKNG